MSQVFIEKLSKNSFIRGGFVFTSASFVVSILNYLFNLVIARGFSLSDYGEYMSAFSYLAVLSVPFSALSVIIINRISKAKVADRAILAKAIERWIVSLLLQYKFQLLLLTGILFGFFYLKTNLLEISIVFVLLSILLNLFSTVYFSVLQAYKAFFIAGLFSLILAFIKLFLGGGVVFFFSQLEYLYVTLVILNVIMVIIGHKLLLFKQKMVIKVIDFKPIQSYVFKRQNILPTLTMLGIIGMLNIDVIMVKKFFDAQQAGLYAGLSLLGKIILYVTAPLSLVAFTFFAGTEHKHNKKKILLFSVFLYLLIGFMVSVVYYIFSDFVVHVVFGEKFTQISSYVWLTAIFGSLYSIVSLFGQYAVSKLSSFGLYSILGLFLQILGLYYFHSSFYDVLGVNIVVMIIMTTIYSVCIAREK